MVRDRKVVLCPELFLLCFLTRSALMILRVFVSWWLRRFQTALLKPGSAARRQHLGGRTLIHRQFLAGQHLFPAAVGSLVEERARAVYPYLPHTRIALFGASAHSRQAGLLNGGCYLLVGGRDVQEVCNPANLLECAGEQVGEMDQQDVVQVSIVPPCLQVVHTSPIRIAFMLPRKPTPGNPF